MRRWIYCAFVLLTACASDPTANQQTAFNDYWDCAFSAARPYIGDTQLPAREAAMRAQAQCYDRYARYASVHAAYSRSVVRPSGYEMATGVAEQASLQKKKYVTARLTEWVEQARRK